MCVSQRRAFWTSLPSISLFPFPSFLLRSIMSMGYLYHLTSTWLLLCYIYFVSLICVPPYWRNSFVYRDVQESGNHLVAYFALDVSTDCVYVWPFGSYRWNAAQAGGGLPCDGSRCQMRGHVDCYALYTSATMSGGKLRRLASATNTYISAERTNDWWAHWKELPSLLTL